MESPTERSPNNFQPVAPEYYRVKLISWALNTAIYLLIALVPLILKLFTINVPLWLILAPPLLVALIALLVLRLLRRRIRALGYAERAEDLMVRSGVMWRKQLVIPYGRMQYVEVTSGPLERRYGLCKLTLNTAAGSATAVIPGLYEATGQELRERLSAAGEAKML
ncbi:PH domain-containing protein [Glutamicibacter sp. NPDC087344]|uniref:PH domain-containing protein n=1 Tax=Glutamicibacter sp. NPDC087344 TaxID=3363994 RepID=UPI003806A499